MIGRKGRARPGFARSRVLGFTLIELMIVVAVVAILAAIAYPSFQEQILKSRRGQAKADMVELAQLAERHHTTNNTYGGFDLTLQAPQRRSPRTGPRVDYNITVTNEAQATFLITATPIGAQTADRCGTLTINHARDRTRSGTAPQEECW